MLLRNFFSYILLLVLILNSAYAEDKSFTFKEGGLTANLEQIKTAEGNQLRFNILSKEHNKSTVFVVPDPNRIVIDLFAIKIKKNKTFEVSNLPLIQAVRFGPHHEKVRIVIDLKSDSVPAYRWSQSKGQITLIIDVPKVAATQNKANATPVPTVEISATIAIKQTATPAPAAATQTPKPTIDTMKEKVSAIMETEEEIQIDPAVPDSDDKEVKIEDLISKKPRPTAIPPTPMPTKAAPTAVATIAPTATKTISVTSTAAAEKVLEESAVITNPDVLPELSAVNFSYANETNTKPVIKLVLSKKSEFEFQKSDNKTYSLKIKGCRQMNPVLKLAHFPPHDFIGFTVVKAEPEGKDINVTIGVERNKRISATPRDNEIWISIVEDERIETKSIPKPGSSGPPQAPSLRGRK